LNVLNIHDNLATVDLLMQLNRVLFFLNKVKMEQILIAEK